MDSINKENMELKRALRYAASKSPYYQNLFNKNNIDISQIQTISDLTQLPTTTKDDLQRHNLEFLCIDKDKIADWVTTSGTLGAPVSFGLSKQDMERLGENEMRSFKCANISTQDNIQLMVTMDKRFMAGLAYYLGCQKLGATTIRVGSGSPGLQLDSIQRFKSTVLVVVPSFLVKILAYASAHDFDLSTWSVKKIVCIGEPIRDQNFDLNNLGKRILSFCPDLKLFGTYASTEMSTAITECIEGRGGHIPEDLIIVELLDDEGNVVPIGQAGEVTVTTLGVEAMPLIRYRTGDISIRYDDMCGCGNNAPRLGPILGRKKQMIKYKGTTIFPNAIFELLNGDKNVKDYVVQLEHTELDTDDVILYVSVLNNDIEIIEKLKEEIRDQLRVLPTIQILSDREMRTLRFPDGSRKPIRIIDDRT